MQTRQPYLNPSRVAKLGFRSKKMLNVLKTYEKQSSDFWNF